MTSDNELLHFVGIDPSLTGTGVCVLNKDAEVQTEKLITSTPKFTIEERYTKIMSELSFVWNIVRLQNVFIEGLSFGSRGQSMLELAGLHYMIRYTMHTKEVPYQVIPPSSLKKFITGKGNAKKEMMLLHTFKKFNVEYSENNMCDAYCLARHALDTYIRGQENATVKLCSD